MKRQHISRVLFGVGLIVLCLLVWLQSRRMVGGRAGLGPSFAFDIERHSVIDPALLLYEEHPPIRLTIDDPVALAVGADNRIFVGGARTLAVLAPDGSEQRRVSLNDEIRSIAVARDQSLFVGVGNHVEVYDATGQQRAVWPPFSRESLPVSIVLRGDDVLVGDARDGQVLRYDRTGELIDRIQGLVLFSSPTLGMAVDAAGMLWVANPGKRELRRYDAAGQVDAAWQRSGRDIKGFSGCCNPIDIAMRPDGALVTAEKNIVRVKVVSAAGDLIGVVAGPDAFDAGSDHLGVAVDSQGRVLVLDPLRQSVRVFVEKSRGEP